MITIDSSRIIDLKELRIGNLLIYNGKLVHVTLLDMDVDDESQETIGFCEHGKAHNEHADWNRALVKNLMRIPIIGQWLINFGFEKEQNSFGIRWASPAIEIGNTIQWFEIEEEKGQYYLRGSEWIMGRPFQYVHQLQNLYYCLIGEELKLTIKETV